jgi:GTP pyrophosphokinase
MVKLRREFYQSDDLTINPEHWLTHVATKHNETDMQLLRQAYELGHLACDNKTIFTGISYLQHSLAIADILENIHLDIETIAAGLLFPAIEYGCLTIEVVEEKLGPRIAKLIVSVKKMDAIHVFYSQSLRRGQPPTQMDNIRKMLLAMAEDVRVVLIKLAERTVIMRELRHLEQTVQVSIAKEIQDIYAPLANRLGIAQIKWELEDLAFRYLQPDIYKSITRDLAMKKSERDAYINTVSLILKEALLKVDIKDFQISGRAKHIYSIHRKMQRKGATFSQIFDVSAIRILVSSLEHCYAVLGVVHSLWQPIPEEFDDYIAQPKANGYRSLHTAVIGPGNHNLEVQIRTTKMHEESELGVAAHWIYKENTRKKSSYDQKISWLRRLLDWQSEVIHTQQIFDDRVYVFTPEGDIIDLPQNATPLDFAYYIHTQLGHRCRGAKVNDKIVPLTYILKTGDRIDILTSKYPNPSRDWMSPNLGYLNTTRARAKVHYWFKQLDYDKNRVLGLELLQRELKRHHLKMADLEQLTEKYDQKSTDDILAAIGAGDIRLGQVINALEALRQPKIESVVTPEITPAKTTVTDKLQQGIHILGVPNLLTRIAICCTPVPSDQIIGYITRGRGISIHRQDCPNIKAANERQKNRLIEVTWSNKND